MMYFFFRLISNFNSVRVKKTQMIQLVNTQIDIWEKKFHKKEKTKNIYIA